HIAEWRLNSRDIGDAWLKEDSPKRVWLIVTHADYDRLASVMDELGPYVDVVDEIKKGWSGAYLLQLKE
ncbi:MAG: hypothetical protein JW941_11840, partial [Candidatus Coatesbacteria bacterium]|nr:hypothetical protein [Candidatus Coatesbacteria bacterium]